ncbi:Elicitin [Phytophthora palmivora]|uniref:Elicitin n=1 Tax=Phytophthora palmivora TaxID=4796 RepID=A0A2P4XSC1_9STRA|nr:Elicitin [Phytophthora palmivora]
MQLVGSFLVVLLLSATFVVEAENCTVQVIYDVLKPVASDPNFATCQTDSNYTLLSFESPSLNQTQEFCTSSACQALLNSTLSSGLLPDCQVVIGPRSFNLTTAVAIASRCGEATVDESAVSTKKDHNNLGHTADNIAAVIGHSVPMEDVGGVLSIGTLRTLAALLVIPVTVTMAETCSTQLISDVLQSTVSDPNYITCQSDSNYTLLSFESPSVSQTRGFCSSHACQEWLHSTLASGVLPDCDVVIGANTLNLTDAATIVASKCESTFRLSLQERVVDNTNTHSKAQRVSGHVATVLGPSAPMDEVGEIAGALLSILRR